jgi:hypothetical protein
VTAIGPQRRRPDAAACPQRRDPDLVQWLDPLVLAITVKLAAAP